jgi:hypothetical protein
MSIRWTQKNATRDIPRHLISVLRISEQNPSGNVKKERWNGLSGTDSLFSLPFVDALSGGLFERCKKTSLIAS